MIGEQYQKQGYGKEAMGKILKYIRTFPVEPAEGMTKQEIVKLGSIEGLTVNTKSP